ncbi:hypothetical protein [Deinococcus sp. YIM 77859]|uniref:hypothetical protein n=1 Tax=Deinococcus sp. YIM 77859 TaxID=1540221 RepID=UPI000552B8D7|nr:hypothetical protein [Deinococcus sp. YIM 77859]
MRHLLTLPALTLTLAACSTHVPQSPAQPPVVVAPTLPACQLVTVRALGGSTLITPVTEGERPTIRVILPGGGYGLGGEGGVAIPPQGLNLAGTVQVEERRPGGFVRCR